MRRAKDETIVPNQEGVNTNSYEWVAVNKILVPMTDDEPDDRVVSEIAESIKVHGLLQPIAVRRVTEKDEDGESKRKIALVFGAHRLKAMKYIGQKLAPCVFVECDERQAELVRLGENLWRKKLTLLQRAEMMVKYLTLASTNMVFSGQVDQKSKRGRPAGGISLAARELPAIGRTVEARRKIIERLTKIAHISPEVKEAAKEAGLDNSQRALLKIAEAGGRVAQMRKLNELAKRSQKSVSGSGGKPSDSQGKIIKSPPLQPGSQRIGKFATGKMANAAPTAKATTLEEMEVFWCREGRELWAYLSFRDRSIFIEMLSRARCKAQVDVATFLRHVLRGRYEINKRDLYALAAARGIAKVAVRQTIKAYGYPAKRKGFGSAAVWYIRNIDREWKEQLLGVTQDELVAARKAQPEPVLLKHSEIDDEFLDNP